MMTCEYIAHSGYIFETSKHILFFDVASGTIPTHYLNSNKEKTFFVSHHHCNHFNRNIALFDMRFIASLDVPLKHVNNVFFVKNKDMIITHDLSITVFDSTDEGVSYLVDTKEGIIFHAGDYNDWHWNQEVSSEDSELSQLQFKSILQDIKHHPIDVACFPCDQRMGPDFDRGPLEFIKECKPKVFCAMHHTMTQTMDDFASKVFKLQPSIQLFIPTQHNQMIEIK